MEEFVTELDYLFNEKHLLPLLYKYSYEDIEILLSHWELKHTHLLYRIKNSNETLASTYSKTNKWQSISAIQLSFFNYK